MRRTALIAALLAPLAAGCDSLVDVERDLELTIAADRQTVPAGQDVSISYDAAGEFLTRITIAFGDGSDPVERDPAGAQTASGEIRYAYDAAGTYTVTGSVFDASGDREDAQITVQVTEANP